jgi:hypothetical protein
MSQAFFIETTQKRKLSESLSRGRKSVEDRKTKSVAMPSVAKTEEDAEKTAVANLEVRF